MEGRRIIYATGEQSEVKLTQNKTSIKINTKLEKLSELHKVQSKIKHLSGI